MRSYHPYDPFIPSHADKLIIGTIPPARFCQSQATLKSRDVPFYYGSSDNQFWPLIGQVFQQSFLYDNSAQAVEQRKSFLAKKGVGITDIIQSCDREEEGASDDQLKNIACKEIKSLLRANTSIKTLIYTSEYVKRLMYKMYRIQHKSSGMDPKIKFLQWDAQLYEVRILFSPSRNALRNMGLHGKEKRLTQYQKFLQ